MITEIEEFGHDQGGASPRAVTDGAGRSPSFLVLQVEKNRGEEGAISPPPRSSQKLKRADSRKLRTPLMPVTIICPGV